MQLRYLKIIICRIFYRQLSTDIKIKKNSKKALVNKTGMNFMTFLKIVNIVCKTMLYMIFQYGL